MKKAISILLVLVMLLGLIPMAAMAEETGNPTVSLTADKTVVRAGEDITLTLHLDKDVSGLVGNWQWNFVWDATYFTAKSSTIGNSATPIMEGEEFAITPIVNLATPTYYASPYTAASVTAGNAIKMHYLKAGVIATVMLTAKQDITEETDVKFFVDAIAVLDANGNAVTSVDTDAATEWGEKSQTLPAESVGLRATVKPVAATIDITAYYADKEGIVTGKDGTLLNFAPVTVTDYNNDGKFTMEEGFLALHETYYSDGTAGYEGSNWVTKFWGITDSNSSYVHNNQWVFSPQEEIKEGDSIAFFWYQDSDLSDWENSYSDLYTYFDNLKGTATAAEETTFHVNGYSVFGSGNIDGEIAHATAAPQGATVTATCEGQSNLTTTVDANGDFKLTFPAAGEWTVLVNGKCSYTAKAGYYANKTYTNAAVVPAQMTVTVAEPAYVAPDPITVYVYSSMGGTPAIVEGKGGTALNYVPITVSDKDADGKLTVNDAFIVLHETYYDGTDGYSRSDSSSTFWGFTSTALQANPFVVINHVYGKTVDTELQAGDKICALYQSPPNFPYAYFDDGITGTATAGETAIFHITGNRSDGKHTLSGATVTATCGETVVTGTNDADGNVKVTFPTAGTYTLVVSGSATLDGQSAIPIHPAMMTVTVAEKAESSATYTVSMPGGKTALVGETVKIAPVIGCSAAGVTVYNAFDLTFTYDVSKLELLSTTIEGLTVTTGDGTIRVQGYGADRAVGTAPFTLKFKAREAGDSNVTITAAKVDISSNAITKDAPDATLNVAATSVSVSGYSVTLPENFTGNAIAEPNKDYTFAEPEDYYDYDVTVKVGGTEVEVTENGDGSYTIRAEDVTGSIVVTATKTGKQFNVTLGTDMSGEKTAQYMTDYTATLNRKNGFTYDVSVTIGGTAYTGYTVSEGIYTIPGADITGEIVFTVTRNAIEGAVFTVTVEGTGAGDVTVSATQVKPDEKLTFTVNMENGYDYDVSITMGGETASYSKMGSDYTINNVTGDVVITVNKSLNLGGVRVYEYVELDGKTVFLVHVQMSLADGKALAYDGNVMFYGRYSKRNSWSYLVIVDKGTPFTAEDAKAKITVTESSYTTLEKTNTDVNESGLTDINDAQLVYDIYNGKYDSFDTVTMRKFLYADVNGDKTVNITDAAAVVAAIQ